MTSGKSIKTNKMDTANTAGLSKNNPIKDWSSTLKRQSKYMHALTNRLTQRQFTFKPEAGRWSIGECIEHLNISMRAYLKFMNPAIEKDKPVVNGDYAKGTLMGRLMLRALRKDGRRYPAPSSFIPPTHKLKADKVRTRFDRQISQLRQALVDCDGLALGTITMPWPVFRFIKISLAQAFELQILHNDRHLKQAEQVIQHVDFPRGKGEFI